MQPTAIWRIILAGFLWLAPFLATAQNARLPYLKIYQVQKTQADLSLQFTNLLVALKMESTVTNVKNADLEVFIDAKAGKIPVKIDPDGSFQIPMREDLLDEDPWILTNQPKGTMKLNWQLGVVVRRMTNTMHYARLMGALKDCEQVQEKMRSLFPGSPRLMMTGLKLIYPKTQAAAVVVIHAKDGDRKLVADENQELIIPLDPALLEEDPEASFTAIPEKIEIVSRNGEG